MGRHTRLQGLQHLRFYAAFAVLAHHILEEAMGSPLAIASASATRVGACGVDIFFVISGLVMWHTTGGFSARTSARRFLSRRLTRIFPSYWACLAILVTLAGSGLAFKHVELDAVGMIESIFLLPPTTSSGLILGVAWTLIYELYFYLVCTAVLCLPWQRLRALSIVALLAAVPFVLEKAGATAQAQYYGSPLVVEFIFGIALGAISTHLPAPGRRTWQALLAACVALFWWASAASPDSATFGLPPSFRWWAWGLPSMLLVALFLHVQDDRSFIGRALTTLGNASYVLYLTHLFWMNVFAKAIKAGAFHTTLSLYLAGAFVAMFAVIFALGVHWYLEKPLLSKLEGKRSQMRGTALS
ncbi:Acyltransferase [Paraburkholderia tropica]|uniref:acyltransferase family protein n=1 Tax=Paraburkholderia tropica TaxID=92647 RepID=UPI001CB1BE6B|nr:acyltransferase [Paraburkholderia tropica]CAG9224113.1 Acyltransferase [Paraburkholderia tropica]